MSREKSNSKLEVDGKKQIDSWSQSGNNFLIWKTILLFDIQFFENFVGYNFENFTLKIKPLSDTVLNFG